MEPQFWHSRWEQGQIGFHLAEVNRNLLRDWGTVAAAAPAGRVYVPLCGKSVDLWWLRQRGHAVVGVELSALACEGFFADHGLPYAREAVGGFVRWRGEGPAAGIELLQGDVFALEVDLLGPIDLLYDRASLIAMPPGLRQRLAASHVARMPAGCHGMVVTIDYPPAERQGPPFAIPTEELRALLEPACTVTLLHSTDLIALQGAERWQTSAMWEHSHLVVRR